MGQPRWAGARVLLCAAVVAALAWAMPAGAQSSLLCACPDIDWDIRPQTSDVTRVLHEFNVEKVVDADMGKVPPHPAAVAGSCSAAAAVKPPSVYIDTLTHTEEGPRASEPRHSFTLVTTASACCVHTAVLTAPDARQAGQPASRHSVVLVTTASACCMHTAVRMAPAARQAGQPASPRRALSWSFSATQSRSTCARAATGQCFKSTGRASTAHTRWASAVRPALSKPRSVPHAWDR